MSCGTRCPFLFLGQDINFLWQEINFQWQEINFLWQELNFLWKEINFLWQEINFLSQEEQSTPHVTGKIFYYIGNALPATGYIAYISVIQTVVLAANGKIILLMFVLWHEIYFLSEEIYFLSQEINFLWQETHQTLINLIVSTRMWWLSLYGLKKHPGLIIIAHCPNGTGAISKLIPWLCIFTQVLSLVTISRWLLCGWWRDFPVVSGEIICWKIRFPRNFKYSPTLPCM